MAQLKYKRILLKFSGEALSGGKGKFGIEPEIVASLAREIGELITLKVQVGLVIGGGNLFRGNTLSALGVDRITGDHMGMLATVMNALALRDAFEKAGFDTRILSAMHISGIVDLYDRKKAIRHLQNHKVVIFAAGTGNPLVTTDTAASLRAIEINADVLLKATNVDGVYSSDPKLNNTATRYKNLTYKQALHQELGVMDLGAFTQCRDHNMKIVVFDLNKPGALIKIIHGEDEGTLVSN
jgi:uridylate kinase